MLDAVQAKNPLAALLPTHCNAWWPLVEDVFSSPACKNLRTTLMDKGISHGECASISVDGTFKVCLPLLGQGRFSDPPAVRDEFPFAGDDAYTRVITVRGHSGAVLGMEPAAGESGADIAKCLTTCLPEAGLTQVKHLATDNPSKKMLEEIQEACPNLQTLSLDPTHTAMKYEQACGGRRTAGSVLLRKFLVKFTTTDPGLSTQIWGPMYAGQDVSSTTPETRLREHILQGSMPKIRADRVLEACAHLKVWPTRLQFVEAIAALASLCAADLQRKVEGTKVTLAKVLYNITAADKAEWLFENLRYRQSLSEASLSLMASGTTTNEALHAEVISWFRQIQAMHKSTLTLKLRIQSLGKLLAHQVALHSPTCSQLPQMLLGLLNV